jgi:hypothetical protein
MQFQPITFDDANNCLTNLANAHRWAQGQSAANRPSGDGADEEALSQPSPSPSESGIDQTPDTDLDHDSAAKTDSDATAESSAQPFTEASGTAPPSSTEAAERPHFFDAGLVDLTLLTNGLLDSISTLRDSWSRQLGAAAATVDVGSSDFETYLRTMLAVIARVVQQFDEVLIKSAGLTSELPEFPPRLSLLAGALGDDGDEARNVIDSIAILTALHDAVRSIRSLREAIVQDSAGRTFWDDGAFHSLMLHLDYFQQTLLQQVDERTETALRRRAPGFTVEANPDEGTMRLTFTVRPQPLTTFYARMTRAAQMVGDYLAVIFHGRNYLHLVSQEPGGIAARAQRAGADAAETAAINEIVKQVERFVTTPTYDLSAIIALAAALIRIVNLLQSVPDAEVE